ncbi:trichohyalin-like [Ostrinia furnacalis]|uniref:trichohyalin-like n=1 Tax=Ostrinia furnacalis TaxID=93504 RepID=UPI0010409B2A|nr:trichohyalin-like [Ostrinia furnacalis]
MEECGYCAEKKEKTKNYKEDLEKKKINECLKALEREKIAKGMQSTREDEKRLREVQKQQMMEKKLLELEEEDREYMWHQVLLDDVRRKEEHERIEADRRHQEMLDRRRAYDEQIASANRKRRQALREERERERRRLERMREKMDQDHYDAIKRKKDLQQTNKKNFIEGHDLKLARLREDKQREWELDNHTIQVALEQLRQERIKRRNQVLSMRLEKELGTETFYRERRIAEQLEEESEKIAEEWKREEENKTDEFLRHVENERRISKEKAIQEYQKHLQNLKEDIEKTRLERSERMQRVSRTAHEELQRKMESANEELRKQIEFRNTLKNQIRQNQKDLETDLISTEQKDWPFSRKSEMFHDMMQSRYRQSSARKSTNPVHPFKKLIEKEDGRKPTVQLPIIGIKYNK